MFKYWLKNRLLLSTVYLLILTVIISFGFMNTAVKNAAEAQSYSSLYTGTKLDFDLPSPGKTQVNDLKNLTHIDEVIPYYFTSKTVNYKTNKNINNVGMLLFDNFNDIDFTMYNSKRVIEKNKSFSDNPIIIDYKFSKETGLTLNDEIVVNFGNRDVTFTIDAVYETNSYYSTNTIVGIWKGEQKEYTELSTGKELRYSGAYVVSKNYDESKRYFEQEYKPYGRLKDRSEFTDEESYQIHYNTFVNSDYSNEITSFKTNKNIDDNKSNDYSNTSKILSFVGSILSALLIIVVNFILLSRKKVKSYFKTRKRQGTKYSSYLSITFLSELIISIIFMTISLVMTYLSLTTYIPLDKIVSIYSIFIGGILVGVVFSLLINRFTIKRI